MSMSLSEDQARRVSKTRAFINQNHASNWGDSLRLYLMSLMFAVLLTHAAHEGP